MRRNLGMTYLRFGTFDLTKVDLVNLEKLILDNITLTDRSDHYVGLGRSKEWFVPAKHVYSSARYIPDKPRVYHRAEIRVKVPNILVAFSSRKTEVFVAREYYKGNVLNRQSIVAKEIEKYLEKRGAARSPVGKLLHRNTIRIAC